MLIAMRRTRTTTMTGSAAPPREAAQAGSTPPTGEGPRDSVIGVVQRPPDAFPASIDVPPATKAVPVREHRFSPEREYSLGIEEELMLVDVRDLTLAAGVEEILRDLRDARIKPELMQCQLELATEPWERAEEALADLTDLRSRAIDAARWHGLRVAAVGTHPYSLAEAQPITARDRYRELVAALRYPARREACCGMHVHVAVGSPDKALRVIEALLVDLPALLALSTSSPFWRGEPTGLHSTRTIVFQSLPRSGLPPAFESFDEYACDVEHLERAGAIHDHSYLWWDVRPHPRYGTIELRCLDVQPRVIDAAAIAGLVQALVRHYGRRYDAGERFASASRLIVSENRWLAARHGLHARLVDPGGGGAVPVRAVLRRMLDRVRPDAEELGAGWALDHVSSLLRAGSSADRQLLLERRGATLEEIVAAVVHETALTPGLI
jgi:glutamate---cysteine ligase / carboxylate-amine ligase